MTNLKHYGILIAFTMALTSCLEDGTNYAGPGGTTEDDAEEKCTLNPDDVNCFIVQDYKVLFSDSFERDSVIDPNDNVFSWRKIINDNGKVIDGEAGKNVDVTIFNDQQMGPALDGSRALYFFGRQGKSIHDMYLVSQTYDVDALLAANGIVLNFDYLTMDLEDGEYLKVEVCNDKAEACGVGGSLSIAGLNSSKWSTVFHIGENPLDKDLNGFNHRIRDWKGARISMFLEQYQKKEFTFRITVRVDEGFIDNKFAKGLEDGVAIDNIRVTAYRLEEDAVNNPSDNDDDNTPGNNDDDSQDGIVGPNEDGVYLVDTDDDGIPDTQMVDTNGDGIPDTRADFLY